jgi:tetratricopeptide (TPR) repeat protein
MKPSRLLPLALALALLPALALAQTPPADGAMEEGKGHFQRGVAIFHEGDFRGALVEFRRAYDLTHNYKVLYNLGQTQFELQDYAGALGSFQRYLADGGAEIDAARRASVEDDLKKLAGRVAKIEIKTNAAGAEVTIDDVLVGRAPLDAPVLVSMGRRKVAVQKGALPPSVRYVEVAAGDVATVSLDLAEAPTIAPPVTAVPPVAPSPPASPPRTGVWISLGVTGALLTGAVVTGVLAVGAHSDAEDKIHMLGVSSADVASAHSKTAALALATDILGGAAIAMGGVTLVLALTGGKREPAPKAAALTLGPRGAALSASF